MTDEFANKLRRALDGNADAFFSIDSSDFDEWLESHDAEVRMDAIIARDTRTSAELMQAAWETACPLDRPCTEIPHGTRIIYRGSDGQIGAGQAGKALLMVLEGGGSKVRTLEPLPPLIPDDCDHVWAGDDGFRNIWTRSNADRDIWQSPLSMLEGARKSKTSDLIDPKPIPKEES